MYYVFEQGRVSDVRRYLQTKLYIMSQIKWVNIIIFMER